jgi:hypothetical protein
VSITVAKAEGTPYERARGKRALVILLRRGESKRLRICVDSRMCGGAPRVYILFVLVCKELKVMEFDVIGWIQERDPDSVSERVFEDKNESYADLIRLIGFEIRCEW